MMNDYLQEAYDNLANAAKEAGERIHEALHYLQEFWEDSGLSELLREIAQLATVVNADSLSRVFKAKKSGASRRNSMRDSRVSIFKARENRSPKPIRCYARNNC